MGVLTLTLLLPLFGALLLALVPGDRVRLIRFITQLAALATLVLAWSLLNSFDPNAGLQFTETHQWNPRLGTRFTLGLDGFSFPMVLLATLLCFVAVLASATIKERVKGYHLLILLLESAMLGVFMAQDWALFYLFWEMTLIPLFFLINRWGGQHRQMASLNFVLYTMGGSVFMLLSLLVVFDVIPGHSFAMADMMAGAKSIPEHMQILIFIGFLIGFGVKMPIFPLHGWLPLAHVQAPSPISILLSGILLKMGAYGLIRAAEMLPHAVMNLQTTLLVLAFINLIYGGLLAWRQSDLKAMIAYSSISHMGVVLLGIATLNVAGLTGAVMQMIAHGLVAGALFLLIGLLYERTQTREVTHYSSMVRSTPRFAFFTSLAFVAAIGMPGTAGFIAELHAMVGGFARWGWIVLLLSLGVIISAAYAIRTVGFLFTGPVRSEMQTITDLQRHEIFAVGLLSAGIIFIGIMPAPVLNLVHTSIVQFSAVFNGM